ncbi:MAG: hypothetical protein QFC55_02885 [Chloroflexota bacterium]|nr:hypothetical protein [Chloroflexota bacterium]
MAVPNSRSLSAEHRRHDRLLVARFAAGDAIGAQEHEARDLVRRCSECAALAADITAISTSVAQMPAAPRSRDFRLTSDQAARMRGSRLDRWLRTISGSGWATVRPLAAVALSVGLVMSVVGALPILGAAGTGAPADTFFAAIAPTPVAPGSTSGTRIDSPSTGPGAAPTPGQVAVLPPVGGASESTADNNINQAYVPTAAAVPPDGNQINTAPEPTSATKAGTDNNLSRPLPGTNSGLRDTILLAGILVTLVALFVLAVLYAARRRYYDPLLR